MNARRFFGKQVERYGPDGLIWRNNGLMDDCVLVYMVCLADVRTRNDTKSKTKLRDVEMAEENWELQ